MAFWNRDEQTEQLKELWAAGHSASKIAKLMGAPSRNVIIGKVFRLGLPGRETNRTAKSRKRRARAIVPPAPPRRDRRRSLNLQVEPLIPPSDYDVPRISFNNLENHHCRWICTPDPVAPHEPSFCGCTPAPGLPYCAQHAARAYSAPSGIPSPHFAGFRSRLTGALIRRMTTSVNLFEDA